MKTYNSLKQNRLLSPLRFAAALLLIVAVVSASSSSAAPAQTYHGTITSGTFLCNGEPSSFSPMVTGTWNLSIDPATPAQVTLTVFYNGNLHLALGYNALMLVSSAGIQRWLQPGSPGTSSWPAAAWPSAPTTR